jgi:hypothetical protein
LTLDNDEIVELLDSYDKESKAFREEALRMCWYMRGGLSYEDAMFLTQQERDIIGKIIKDNMETTQKSGLPFF